MPKIIYVSKQGERTEVIVDNGSELLSATIIDKPFYDPNKNLAKG